MFTVSVRFNRVSVRALKQIIVPCKLLISATGITVFVGSYITDATPIFHQALTAVHWSGRPASTKALILRNNNIALSHKPQHLRYFFNRETRYLIQLCISGIVIRAFIAILIP